MRPNHTPVPAQGVLTLSLQYASRILVPRGADLKVSVHDVAGKTVGNVAQKTKSDGPPYPVTFRIPADARYPLTVTASLVSQVGHRFSSSTELNPEDLQQKGPVPIQLEPER